MKKLLIVLGLVFALASNANAQLLTETFTYPDGPLVGASGSPWVTNFSSPPGQQNVVSGRLFLDDDETEDTKAWLPETTSGVISATFELTIAASGAAAPGATDKYITHFIGDGDLGGVGMDFIGRVFTSRASGGSTNTVLGLSNSSSIASVQFATELLIGQTYTLTLGYDFAAMTSTLSVDGIGSIIATDPADGIVRIDAYGFRQQSNTGDSFVDNLRIVVPEPGGLVLIGFGISGLLLRRRR